MSQKYGPEKLSDFENSLLAVTEIFTSVKL